MCQTRKVHLCPGLNAGIVYLNVVPRSTENTNGETEN